MVTTSETIARRAPYIEAREKALFDELFGSFDEGSGTFSGGLLDAELYPELFTIPQYEIAGQMGRDPETGAITGIQYDEEGNVVEGTGLGAETFASQVMATDANKDGIPDWLGRAQQYFDSGEDLLGITEGSDGAKQQFADAADVLKDAKSYYGDVGAADQSAVDLLQSGAGVYDPSSTDYGVSKFMSGYTDDVLGEVEKDIERQGATARNRAAAQAAKAGAFGGSRQGIQEAEIERNILDAKAKASADLNQKAYDQALQASMGAYEKGQTRNLEAGRLMGGLGQSYGSIGTSMGGLGAQQAGAAGTAADIGRVYSSLSPADLAFMTGVGQQERQYRQDVIDTERMEGLRGTEQAMYPINVAMNLMQGMPSASVTSQYQTNYAPSANPMVSGLGAYTAMQGINQSG